MSSESLPQGIFLIVKYYGAKAQHFTKDFTPFSSMLFRKDLSTMRFPHPKVVNTRLAPDASVIAWWPDVSHKTHHVLHNNLTNSTNAAASEGLLAQLSISSLVVREMDVGGKNPIQLASARLHDIQLPPAQGVPPPAKKPRIDDRLIPVPPSHPRPPVPAQQNTAGTVSHSVAPQPPQIPWPPVPPAPASQSTTTASSTAQKRSWDGRIIPSGLPAKPPPPSGGFFATTPSSVPSQPQPTHTLPPPKPLATLPNGQGASAARPASNALNVPKRQSSTIAQGVPTAQSASAAPRALAPPVQASGSQTTQDNKPTSASTSTPAVAQSRPTQPPSGPRALQQSAVNQEQIQNYRLALVRSRTSLPALLGKDRMIVAQLKALGAVNVPAPLKLVDEVSLAAKDAELEALRKRLGSMEEMVRTQMNVKVRLDETANKLEEEQQARAELEKIAAAARQGEADALRRLEEAQKLLAEERWRHDEAEGLLASARQDAMSYHQMHGQAEQERDEFERQLERTEGELGRTTQKLEQAERDYKGEKDRRRRYQDRLASADRRESELKERVEGAKQEIASLTLARTIDADNTRAAKERDGEALRLGAEKSRTQQLVIRQAEGAMRAAQFSEEASKRRLKEAESKLEEVESRLGAELEAERRLRWEAEDAIADIRRECRVPFVVPSLLDAFVELAKLTTAATTSDGLDIRGSNGKEMAMEQASDTPPTMDGAADTSSDDALSPHYSPRTPQSRAFSPHHKPPSAQLKPSNPPNDRGGMVSFSSPVKVEQASP